MQCAVCRVPLDPLRARESRVCRAPKCVVQYDLTPAARKCPHCGIVMPVSHSGAEHCGDAACRMAAGHRRERAVAEREAERYAIARAARDAAVQALGPDGGDGAAPDDVPIAIVPRNEARMRRTSRQRHLRLAVHIRQLLMTMRDTSPDEDVGLLEQPDPLPVDQVRTVISVCTACGGGCCFQGGDHAFLRVRTMRDFVAKHPTLTDDEIVEAYVVHLPPRALHPGCVYQAAEGCTLPRSMRSAICNEYLCSGLRVALDAVQPGVTQLVYVAHADADGVPRGHLRSLPVLQ